MPDFESNKCCMMIGAALFIAVAGVLVIVLPMSFATLEYHEVGINAPTSL